jgi:hypothetical protein
MCGYRVEVSVFGGSIEEAISLVEKYNLLNVSSLSKILNISSKVICIQCYFREFYFKMHCALTGTTLAYGASNSTLTAREKSMYISLLNQMGFHFGNDWSLFLKRELALEDWTICICTVRGGAVSRSMIQNEPPATQKPDRILQMVISGMRRTKRERLFFSKYKLILEPIGLTPTSLEEALIYYDILMNVGMSFPYDNIRFQNLKGRLINGSYKTIKEAISKLNELHGANWRDHVKTFVPTRGVKRTKTAFHENVQVIREEARSLALSFEQKIKDWSKHDYATLCQKISRMSPRKSNSRSSPARTFKFSLYELYMDHERK